MRATRLERRKRRRTGKKTKRYEIYVIEKDSPKRRSIQEFTFSLSYNQNNNSRGKTERNLSWRQASASQYITQATGDADSSLSIKIPPSPISVMKEGHIGG